MLILLIQLAGIPIFLLPEDLCALMRYAFLTILGTVWLEMLKFNKLCSTFVLFNKKFLILD
jgi:hypothetical protein